MQLAGMSVAYIKKNKAKINQKKTMILPLSLFQVNIQSEQSTLGTSDISKGTY